MSKEPLYLEYSFKSVSTKALWQAISDTSKLSEWFAEKVEEKNGIYLFYWEDQDEPEEAKLEKKTAHKIIRFRILDTGQVFEMKILQSELTKEIVLAITDHCDIDDFEFMEEVWNEQIKVLCQLLGVK